MSHAPQTSVPPDSEGWPSGTQRPRMEGRVVFITGGTRGIGAAIARSFAEQGAVVAAGYSRDRDNAQHLLGQLERHGIEASLHQGNTGQANYAASKSGLFGLTKSFAREACHQLQRAGKLAEDSIGLTVNAVAPRVHHHRDARSGPRGGARQDPGSDPRRPARPAR